MRAAIGLGSHRTTALLISCGMFLLVSACDASYEDGDSNTRVNGSIHVTTGRAAADVRTVNGSIKVDDDVKILGATAVNGSVTLGAHAKADALKTVNGAISLDQGSHASQMTSVNGSLTLKEGAEVGGSVTNVNGNITVTGAHVSGKIHTVAGDITLSGATQVEGGILVDKPGSTVFNSDDPVIIIGPGVTVGGELTFERKVHLFVSDKATIGKVTGATPVSFSGDKPPSTT